MISSHESTILWIYAGLIAIWPIRYVVVSWIIRYKLDILTPVSPRYDQPDPPLVSAIIPARDEEAVLQECLESVCAQTYPNMEILIVDDRSTDGTAAIARMFADADPRARVITIKDLPPGWTGKTHALQVASGQARGEWFWFLDADTRHAPENLAIVMEYARKSNAAMASLLPEMRCETFWESVVQPLAGIDLIQAYPLNFVNDDRNKLAFANGQYILIRRDAYFQSGGHEAVRDRFVEDIAMAYRVKGLGLPIRVAIAHGIGSTRMYASLGQLVRGWSRILYDALDRSPLQLLIKILDPLVFSQTGHIALLASLIMLATSWHTDFAWMLLGLSVVHHAFTYLVLRKLYLLTVPGSKYVAWFPLANLIMDWVMIQSIRMCLTGQVTWRGTAYGAGSAVRPRRTPRTTGKEREKIPS